MEKEKVPVSLLTLVAGILVTIVSFWVGQNHNLLPIQASQQAPLVDGFFNVMMTIGTALFLVVEGTILLFAIIFRQRKGDDKDGEPIKGNFSLEVFWTAIPSIIVIALGIYSVEVYRDMGGFEVGGHNMMAHHHSHSTMAKMSGAAIAAPLIADTEGITTEKPAVVKPATIGIGATPAEGTKPADLVVNVTGMQFAWIFNYPGDVTAGELHVPIGKDVQINLAATDVIHSFWVPQFRLKQDAIPGQATELRFVATRIGEYPIVCAELCGSYHGAMRSTVIVQSQEDYDSWLAETQVAQQQDLNQAVAVNPANLSTAEFIAPYAQEMGINSDTLAQIHHSHQ